MVLLALVATAYALEWAVTQRFVPPASLRERALAVQRSAAADPGPERVVVFGTCLAARALEPRALRGGLGADWDVHVLGTEGTGAVDWALTTRNLLPLDAVDAIVVAWTAGDLQNQVSPWESRMVDLATWRDVPDLGRHACEDLDCAVEVGLRKASYVYRWRGFLAARLWSALGIRRSGWLTLAGLQHRDEVIQAQHTPAHEAGVAFWLRDLVATARGRGVKVVFARIPLQGELVAPTLGVGDPGGRLLAVAVDAGALAVSIPGVDASLYETSSHLGREGATALSRHLGEVLRGPLGLGDAEEGQDGQGGDEGGGAQGDGGAPPGPGPAEEQPGG